MTDFDPATRKTFGCCLGPINLALTVSCNTGYVKTSKRSKTGRFSVCLTQHDLFGRGRRATGKVEQLELE